MGNGKYEPSNRKLLEEVHDKVNQLYTVVLGVPGTEDKGLVEKVNLNCTDIDKVKTRLWILIGILFGSGIITGSAIGIEQLVGG